MPSSRYEPNRWKGFAAGVLGSVFGLLAMRYYWKRVSPAVERALQPVQSRAQAVVEQRAPGLPEQAANLYDDIAIPGQVYREGESSTAALARLIYRALTGHEPRAKETQSALSELVHWVYGLLQGGVYGAMSAGARGLDLGGGMTFAVVLWLFGDEVAVPLLGLQSGPTAATAVQHANRLGAHLAYGAGTAAATRVISRLL